MSSHNGLEKRVDQLLTVWYREGCEVCAHWSGVVLADDYGFASRPESCPSCGRVVPYTVVVTIDGIHLEEL